MSFRRTNEQKASKMTKNVIFGQFWPVFLAKPPEIVLIKLDFDYVTLTIIKSNISNHLKT